MGNHVSGGWRRESTPHRVTRGASYTAHLRIAASLLLVAATTPAVRAQGTVTDGDASFTYVGFDNGSCADRVSFVPGTVGSTVDVAWQNWWWLGINGAPESQLPTPSTQSYVGDTATLSFSSIGISGLDATLIGRVIDGAVDNAANWQEELTIFNGSPNPVTLDVFQYADIEVGGTYNGDLADRVAPGDATWIRITDPAVPTNYQDHRALAPSGYRVVAYNQLCLALADGIEDDLLDTGLPFGPGDYTGAFEWREVQLASGASIVFSTAIGIGEPAQPAAIFADGFESSDTSSWSLTFP